VDNPKTAARILCESRKSPFYLPSLINTSAPVTHWQLGMRNGALFGVPIPKKYEAIGQTLQEAVEVALAEAEENGVNKRGKEATPWLLKRVGELTEGKSLASSQRKFNSIFCAIAEPYHVYWFVDIALIENTALVGMCDRLYSSRDQIFTDILHFRRQNSHGVCQIVGATSRRPQ